MHDLNFVRPMRLREIFANALTLYARHLKTFIAITLLYLAFQYILQGIIRWKLSDAAQGTAYIIIQPLLSLAYAATVIAASNAVLGRPVRVIQAYRRVIIPRILLIMLIFSLPFQIISYAYERYHQANFSSGGPVNLLGTWFDNLIFPALVVALHTLLLFRAPVTVLEKRGTRDTIRRVLRLFVENIDGKTLTVGFAWRFLLFIVMVNVPFVLVTVPALLYVMVTGQQLSEFSIWLGFQVLTAVLDLFASPYGLLLSILLYYDIRARKEAYNALALAEEMGYQPITEMIAV